MKRRIEQLSATTALAGSLLALSTVACSPDKSHSVEAPSATIGAASPGIETPRDSPQNRVGRCVLAASRQAILEVMNSPHTVLEHDPTGGSFDAYVYGSEFSSVVVDTSVPDQTTLVYSVNVHSGEPVNYNAMGRVTLPVNADSVKRALVDIKPKELSADAVRQAIQFESSGITLGETINKKRHVIAGAKTIDSVGDDQDKAAADCALVEDFTEQLQQEYDS